MNEINYKASQIVGKKPVITKLGAIRDSGEQTPFVFNGELLIAETIDVTHAENMLGKQYFRIRNVESGFLYPPFAEGCYFSSAYTENGTVYVFGTTGCGLNADWTEGDPRGGSTVRMFWSDDLYKWSCKDIITLPEWRLWNTSVCKDDTGYKMAFEVMGKQEYPARNSVAGVPFTEFFAQSDDLFNWTVMPDEYSYSASRYVACPALRYDAEEKYYYMVCLEALPAARYAPYIYRSRNLKDWEIGYHNPVLMYYDDYRKVKPDAHVEFSAEQLYKLKNYININNSDLDFCEYKGKTYIFYLTGNQQTYGFMCEAVYDGGLYDFLRAFFR